MDAVINALAHASVSENTGSGVTFEGNNLKWDTANDAKSLIDAINSCRDLEYLNLAGNTLGVEAAEAISKALEKHPEFKRALWKDLFTGRLKAEIPKALHFLGDGLVRSGARLTVLDLSDNAFGPIGVKGLASLLSSSSCYNLKELRLNNNGLGISGGKLLAKALMDCYNNSKASGNPLALQVLIAGRNRLENDGAKALAEVFKTIGTFEEIAMPQNGIYYPGITALSEAFSKNKNLRILNLNDNTIGPKGSLALSQALPNLQKLTNINFGDCLLKTKGAIHIAEALKDEHLLLEELNLDFNEIRAEGGVAVAKAMKNKCNLKTLMIDGNQFGLNGRETIENELRSSGNLSALISLDENESEQSENEDDVKSGNEEESEENYQEEDDIDEEHESNTEIQSCINVADFLELPTADNFWALGGNRTDLLLSEFKNVADLEYLDRFVPVIMKVSSIISDAKPEIAEAATNCTNAMYKSLFEWAEKTEKTSLMNNSLLVHLGLIKSEDKKYIPPWNVDGCMLALETAIKQQYFLPSTRDTLKVFMERCRGDSSEGRNKLIGTLRSL